MENVISVLMKYCCLFGMLAVVSVHRCYEFTLHYWANGHWTKIDYFTAMLTLWTLHNTDGCAYALVFLFVPTFTPLSRKKKCVERNSFALKFISLSISVLFCLILLCCVALRCEFFFSFLFLSRTGLVRCFFLFFYRQQWNSNVMEWIFVCNINKNENIMFCLWLQLMVLMRLTVVYLGVDFGAVAFV